MGNSISNDNQDVEELLQKYDKEEGSKRKLIGKTAFLLTIIAIAMSAFHLYTAAFGTLLAVKQRALHLVFVMAMGFMIYPITSKARKDRVPLYDYALSILGIIVFGYLIINY